MGFDLLTFFLGGVKGSFLPAPLVTAGVFALGLLFLRQAKKGAMFWFVVDFLIILVLMGLASSLRAFDLILGATGFFEIAMWFYIMVALIFFAVGAGFLFEWVCLIRGKSLSVFAGFIWRPVIWKAFSHVLAVSLALCLAFFANAWPSNYQALIQGEMAWSPGKLLYSVGMLLLHEVFRNAAVLFVLVVFLVARREKNKAFLQQRHTLISILMSAAYFSVGGMVIFLYITGTQSTVQFL